MAFPQTPLGITVELQINSVWTDVSADVRSQGGTEAITIQRGITSSGGTVADRGTCTLTLDNNTGTYSSRNPRSPYYGYLGRNTPLRVGVAYGTPWLAVSEGGSERATTPDAAVLDITGDLDVRVDFEPAVWGDYRDHVGGSLLGDTELVGKYVTTGNQRSWRLLLSDQGRLNLGWSVDGTSTLVAAESDVVNLPPYSRLSVRATLDVDNGAGGNTVTFYTSSTPGTAGPWTQLGSPVVTAGTTSIFNSTAPLEVGDLASPGFVSLAKKIFSAEVRSGIGGTVVANPNFEAQAVGAASFADTAPSSRAWTVTAGAITNVYRRFAGEVASWPPQWDTGGKDVTTPIVASGLLQRLGQRKAPVQSTLRRRLGSVSGMVAYWPMEDGAGATQASSPLPSCRPLRATGLTWASDSSLAGSAALPQLAPASSIYGSVPGNPLGDWHVEFVYKLDALPASPTLLFQVSVSGGTASTVQLLVGVAVIRIQALDANGTVIGTFDSTPTNFTDGWGRIQIYTSTTGGVVSVVAGWLVIGAASAWNVFASFPGSPGRAAAVSATWGSAFADLRIGHIGVMPRAAVFAAGGSPYDNADKAFDGESAAARLARVASEQGITMSVAAHAADTELVGAQAQDTVSAVLQAAAQADEGLLHEMREALGLRYRGRRSLEGQPSALDLPYVATPQALMAPLTPVDDDQLTLNDSTVQRAGGSSARVTVSTGALSTLDPPAGVGTYDESIPLALHSDDQAVHHAGWRTHLGTWDEARFPQVNIELAKNPSLIPAAARIDTGSRLRITSPLPSWLPPDAIDNLMLGYTETLAQFSWRMQFACQPYGPWRTGVLDDYSLGRLDSDGSSLAASALVTDTTLSVATASGPLWTTDPAEAPWTIRVAGEVIRVDAVGSIINANPYLDTASTGWSGTGATVAWSTAQLHPDGARGALLITPDGVSASGGANAAMSGSGTITAGASYVACLWAYSPGGWSDLRPAVDWYTSGSAFISTSLGSGTSVAAGAWTFLTQTFVAPATAARAVMRARHGGTPASANTWYAWGIRLLPVITTPSSPQTFQVTRGINGITKAQASGADVRLDQPIYLAL
jgi:hypothetical protein